MFVALRRRTVVFGKLEIVVHSHRVSVSVCSDSAKGMLSRADNEGRLLGSNIRRNTHTLHYCVVGLLKKFLERVTQW